VLKDENVDCVVVGEGENTMLDLVKRIEHGEGLTGIPGTMYRRNGQVRRERPRPFIENLDELPFPAWHLLDKEGLVEEAKRSPFVMRRPAGAMVTSRGCPYNCYFCSVRKIWSRKWRARSPENVVDEMEFLKNVHGFQEIQWLDDNGGFVTGDQAGHVLAEVLDLFVGSRQRGEVHQVVNDDARKLNDRQAHGHTSSTRF